MSENHKHIPQDVMETAQRVYEAAMSHLTDTRAEVEIALALLAERERCAELCEEYSMGTPYANTPRTHGCYIANEAYDESHQGTGYAALIRYGVEGETTAAVSPALPTDSNQATRNSRDTGGEVIDNG